ncbi:YnfC family lipoprotein, partial [Salmonella enterica subsp. enterica serovar Anatum]|nr:YnfC family lipoprotein [Salmonella enterica subsp. enterica serovar Anatum]
ADPRKKLDYTAVSRVDDRQVGNVTQSCEYDAYANPVDCRLVIDTPDSLKALALWMTRNAKNEAALQEKPEETE